MLDDDRINIASGYGDVAGGSVDPRILALLLYLAETHGEVTVSCLISGHNRFVAQTTSEKKRKAPRRVSAHTYGRAVDISSIGGVRVIGNQQPGGIVDRAVRQILSLRRRSSRPGDLAARPVGPVVPAARPRRPPPRRLLESADGGRAEGGRHRRVRRCVVADSAWTRTKGLLGRASLDEDEGILLRPGGSIHMFFMRFPIDAVFLDREQRVLRVAADLKPWRMASKRGAKAVLECPPAVAPARACARARS